MRYDFTYRHENYDADICGKDTRCEIYLKFTDENSTIYLNLRVMKKILLVGMDT